VLITIRFVYHSINPLDMRQSVAVEPSFPLTLTSHWRGTPGARFAHTGLANKVSVFTVNIKNTAKTLVVDEVVQLPEQPIGYRHLILVP